MQDGVILGVVERRRRWTDESKLAILGEVGVDGWTVADVARRHDVTRQHIYQWRREMRRKGLRSEAGAPSFLPVEFSPDGTAASDPVDEALGEVTIILRNGLHLRCPGMVDGAVLVRLVRLLEAA